MWLIKLMWFIQFQNFRKIECEASRKIVKTSLRILINEGEEEEFNKLLSEFVEVLETLSEAVFLKVCSIHINIHTLHMYHFIWYFNKKKNTNLYSISDLNIVVLNE